VRATLARRRRLGQSIRAAGRAGGSEWSGSPAPHAATEPQCRRCRSPRARSWPAAAPPLASAHPVMLPSQVQPPRRQSMKEAEADLDREGKEMNDVLVRIVKEEAGMWRQRRGWSDMDPTTNNKVMD
jgi:hypothetical protein